MFVGLYSLLEYFSRRGKYVNSELLVKSALN
jgi:hypothetical protein